MKPIEHRLYRRVMIMMLYLLGSHCSDPLSEDEDAVIRTLVQGILPSGEYVWFWDGTDDSGAFVPAGTYYARLYSRDFTYQIEMTALEGGSGESNDMHLYNEGVQPLTKLEQNRPNPFRIRDGTNIPFFIDEITASVPVQLTVRSRE